MEEYGFEMLEQWLRDTLAPNIVLEAALAMVHPPEEEFVDPTDWETEFFSKF